MVGSILTWVTFDVEIDQSLLKGCGFESRQVYFNYLYIQSTNNTLTSQIESYGRHIWQQSQGFVNSIYRFPIFICALSPGPLRRMQLSNAYTLRRVYSVRYQAVATWEQGYHLPGSWPRPICVITSFQERERHPITDQISIYFFRRSWAQRSIVFTSSHQSQSHSSSFTNHSGKLITNMKLRIVNWLISANSNLLDHTWPAFLQSDVQVYVNSCVVVQEFCHVVFKMISLQVSSYLILYSLFFSRLLAFSLNSLFGGCCGSSWVAVAHCV